jgi:GT2 family glycosyltransferase
MTAIAHVGVVVVSYNVRDLLARCLQSIVDGGPWTVDSAAWTVDGGQPSSHASDHRSTVHGPRSYGPPSTLSVVDNASADGSAEMVRRDFPQFHLIASPDNLGFARGNNLALREMIGRADAPDAILLLNPDAELLPGALAALVACLDAHAEAGMAGAQLQYGDGRFQHGAFRFPSLAQIFLDFFPLNWRLTASRLNGRYPRALYDRNEPFAVDFVLGASMLVRTAALRQVGLLDEGYFMYAEEMDWAWRMHAAGWSVYCAPAARVIHHEGQSSRQFRERMYVALWRSRYRFFERYYPSAWRMLARRLVRLGVWAEARRARQAAAQGAIDAAELERRLQAYREVSAL